MNQIEYMKKTFDFFDKALGFNNPFPQTPKREKCDACGLEAGQEKLCEKCKAEVEQGWEEWEIEKAKELLMRAGWEVKKKEAGSGEEKPNS